MTFIHEKVVNIFIFKKINLWPFNVTKDFVLGNSLFRVVKLSKNLDLDKYRYSGYGIGFHAHGFQVFCYQMVVCLVII